MKKPSNQKNKPVTEDSQLANSNENKIIIQTEEQGALLISLIDQSGKVVYEITKEAYGKDLIIDLTGVNLEPGLYLVKLTSDQISKVVKIFKK